MRFGAVAGIAVLGLVAAAAIRSEWFSAKRGEPAGPRDAKLVNLPLRFEPNLGQLGARTAFAARTPGFSMLLDARGMSFELASKGGDYLSECRLASWALETRISSGRKSSLPRATTCWVRARRTGTSTSRITGEQGMSRFSPGSTS
jgi:hypothetical protein